MEKIKIVFASCNRYEASNNKSQPNWKFIEDVIKPDYLFLLGDQIYMDFGIAPFSQEPLESPMGYSLEKFCKVMRAKYKQQWEEPYFKSLFTKMAAKDAVFGVWDDHDFAWDNAVGKVVPEDKKNASREIFHEYMNKDKRRNGDEVYFYVDLPAEKPIARAIFLDNRFYADKRGAKKDLLGEEQFKYLVYRPALLT